MHTLARIPQLLVYGVVSGSILSLGGIGVSLTFSILGFSNFAHGDIMAVGAYIALAVLGVLSGWGFSGSSLGSLSFGWPFLVAVLVAMACTAGVVILVDRILFRRLRRSGSIILMISSIGVALAFRNILLFFWGPQPQYYVEGIQMAVDVPWLGVHVKPDQLFVVAAAAVLVTALYLFLRYTRIGKAMRATADNMDLSRVTGINTERIVLWTWVIGGSLATAAGALAGLENKFITPELGWQLLLSIFAAVILGGLGNVYGAIAGGMVIGLAEEVSTAFVSTGYKPAIAFVVLIVMLLVRPSGLLGKET